MATTVARVEIDADLDGSDIPRQARALGELAGRTAGDSLSKSFDKSVNSGMADALRKVGSQFSAGGAWDKEFLAGGRRIGNSLAKGFSGSIDSIHRDFDFMMDDVDRLESSMGRLAIGPGFTEDIGELRQVFDDADDSVRRTNDGFTILWRELEAGSTTVNKLTDDVNENTEAVGRNESRWRSLKRSMENLTSSIGGGIGGAFRKLGGFFGEHEQHLERHISLWRRLSHNTRQWTLIIAAVTAALPQLATLSSAAGSGLFILGGALSGLITGGVFAGVAFARFLGDLEKVPEAVRPAREAFDEFGKTFGEVMGEMTVHAFKDTERAWNHFGEVVRALQPGFNAIGDVVNKLVTDLSDNLDTSTIENLNGFLEGSAWILDRVVRAIGRVGDALLVAFNNPQFQQSLGEFLGWIDLIADRFSAFLTGPGFDEWLEHGRAIFGAFGSLLDTTGRLLNNLVTDETVGQLTDFIGNIERFLQGGGKGILDFAQELDVFGLAADALASFGDALEPLAGPMKDFAEGIHDVFSAGIDTLAPIIEDIATALAPFVQALADFMRENPEGVANALIAIAAGFAALKLAKVGAIAVDMALFSTSMVAGGAAVRKFDVGKLTRIGGGLLGIAAIAAAQLIPDSFWKQFDIESNLPKNVLTGAGWGALFGGWGAAIGAGLGIVYSLFTEFETTMNDIGLRLSAAFTTGPWGIAAVAVAEWFAGLIPEEWATSDNPMERFLGTFKTSVEEFGTVLTTATDEIGKLFDGAETEAGELETALGIFFANTKTAFETWQTDVTTTWGNTWVALGNPSYWNLIGTAIGTFLGTAYADFVIFSTNAGGIWSSFWATANSPAFWNSIQTQVQTFLINIASYFSQKTAEANTFWTNFWVNLPAIANQKKTEILTGVGSWLVDIGNKFQNLPSVAGSAWSSFWSSLSNTVQQAMFNILGFVASIINAAQNAANASASVNSGASAGGGGGRIPVARGAIFTGPTRVLAGEAGPEAFVPLRRPLSQVDPSVRWLSAIAQGKMPLMAGGGIVSGGGKQVTVESGAFVLNEVGDSRRTANDVITRLAEFVNG